MVVVFCPVVGSGWSSSVRGRVGWGVGLGVVLGGWSGGDGWVVPVVSCASIVLLPVEFVAGHVGQSSSARYAMAGSGAWVAGRLVAVCEIPVLSRLLAGVAAGAAAVARSGLVGSGRASVVS